MASSPAEPESLLRAMDEAARSVGETLDLMLPVRDTPERQLVEAMRYAALGAGKRLRPFLVITSADLFGVGREQARRVAAAVELVHCYSLVHDDLPAMDDDDMRRGRPTVHKAFDEATAILAGDGLLTKAFEVLAVDSTHSDPHVRFELVWELAQAAGHQGMVGGQMMDLVAETMNGLDVAQITRLQRLKTGRLIGFSCEAGAIMGKAPRKARLALQAYAHDLGLAFQIADDLLDVEGDAAVVGKATGKDAGAGKATFVSLLGVARAREQARMLSDQAVRHLDVFGDDEAAALLRAVARFTVERRR